MSESKNDTINEFFKVQQINDYQRAFEELRNRIENNRETRQNNIVTRAVQLNRSPANDNNKEVHKGGSANQTRQLSIETENNSNLKKYACKDLNEKSYCCVLL